MRVEDPARKLCRNMGCIVAGAANPWSGLVEVRMAPVGLALLTLVFQLAASVAVGCHRGYLGCGAVIEGGAGLRLLTGLALIVSCRV